jgi:hypothetical protein
MLNMKKTLFIVILSVAICGAGIAQDRDRQVPSSVQHAFQRDYPDAREPHWTSDHGQWHADFDDHSRYDRGEMVAHYDRYGRHIDSHIPYDPNDVPRPVMERMHRRYHARDYYFERIERPHAEPLFRVNLSLDGGQKTVYMDEYGHERMHSDRH